MKAKYRVDEATLDDCIEGKEGSREFFRVQGVYTGMKKIDVGYHENRVIVSSSAMSPDAAVAAKQITELIGFYDAIRRTNVNLDAVVDLAHATSVEDVENANHIYSLKAAVECGLQYFRSYIEHIGGEIQEEKYVPAEDFTVSTSRTAFRDNKNNFSNMYKQLVASCTNGRQLFEKTYRLFEYLGMALQVQFEGFKDCVPKEFFREHHLSVDGYDVFGMSGDVGREVELNFGNRDFSHSIGNEEPSEILKRVLKVAGCYDMKSQTNALLMDDPKAKPVVILFRGRPGTGKSDLCNITAANMQDIAERKGMRFQLIALNNQQKSKWYADTGVQTRTALNKALNPRFLTLIYADDFDMVAGGREHTTSGADNEYSYELMNWLDGVGTQQYRGNFIMIINTNKPERLDSAIKNRCTYNVEVKGPTVSTHYVSQMKLEFGQYLDFVNLAGREWKDIGNLCENIVSKQGKIQINGEKKTLKEIIEGTTIDPDEFKLSGRDINKICSIAKDKIKSSVDPDGLPENFSDLDADEKRVILRGQYTPMDATGLKEIIVQRYEGNIAEKLKEFKDREQRIADQYFLEQKGIARGKDKLKKQEGGGNGKTKQ